MAEWIPVKERLPDKYVNVLLANKRNKQYDVDKGWWDGSGYRRCGRSSYGNVTHWMPLQEPPKD